MKYLPILLLLVGCQSDPQKESFAKEGLEAWARNVTNCQEAKITITSFPGSSIGPYSDPITSYIIGCGMKICCNHQGNLTCFPCKVEGKW